jgi:hypothetical protein
MAQRRSADGSYRFEGCIECFQPRDTIVKPEPASKKRKQRPGFAAASENKNHTLEHKEADNGSGDVEAAPAPARERHMRIMGRGDNGGAVCAETDGIPVVSFLPALPASS